MVCNQKPVYRLSDQSGFQKFPAAIPVDTLTVLAKADKPIFDQRKD
jgi:hypothetical protein